MAYGVTGLHQRGFQLITFSQDAAGASEYFYSANLGFPAAIPHGLFPYGYTDADPYSVPGTCWCRFAGHIFAHDNVVHVVSAYANVYDLYDSDAGVAVAGARACCTFRDRLVLGGGDPAGGSARIVRASKVGDEKNWDVSVLAADASWAISYPDDVLAVIPATNDVLFVMCSRSIHRIVGDPANGGVSELVTDQLGIFQNNAWTQSPDGAIYFACSSGFMRMTANGAIENLSDGLLAKFFEQLYPDDRSGVTLPGGTTAGHRIILRWDKYRHGCWIFCAINLTENQGEHLWYDARTKGFFPQRYFDGAVGPLAALVYQDDADPTNRVILTGGWDEVVRQHHERYLNDDLDAVLSYVYIGPIRPAGDVAEMKMIGLDATLGESVPEQGFTDSDWNLDWQLQVAQDPFTAYDDPQQTKAGAASWTTPGHQNSIGLRFGGNSFWLLLSNLADDAIDHAWSVDRITGRFLMAGLDDGKVP